MFHTNQKKDRLYFDGTKISLDNFSRLSELEQLTYLHREDGPAVENEQTGTELYYLNGEHHPYPDWLIVIKNEEETMADNDADVKNYKKKTLVWVTFEKEGIHKYPAAGEREDLKDVAFLQYPHRHMFKFKVYIEVKHNDRDVEFIQFKRELEKLYGDGVLHLDYKSCEMMAEDLLGYITSKYPERDVKIEVSEDGENGCILEYSE